MQLVNELVLARPLPEAWALLTDLERVAPAMPGVQVERTDDEGLHATMRVKVGPITVGYTVVVAFDSRDEATHTAVLRARGRETRGQGSVDATVSAALVAAGDDATKVTLTTDLAITGRVAQFGGGVMKEVADRLLRQFGARLDADADAAGTAPATAPAGETPRASASAGAPVDLGAVAGPALLTHPALTATLAGLVLFLLGILVGRRGR